MKLAPRHRRRRITRALGPIGDALRQRHATGSPRMGVEKSNIGLCSLTCPARVGSIPPIGALLSRP